MAINEELTGFIRDALLKGQTRAQIEDVLLRAGWEPDQVKGALATFAEIDFPIPVPRPKPYQSAREAFMYFVLFTTLYIFAHNIGTLLFQFINKAFPDPAAAKFNLVAVRWSVSSLIVAFPVFLWLSRLTNRAISLDPNKRISKIRQQLTYLTLFVAAAVIFGDFIVIVYNFLSGELTIRFILKALTTGLISGTIFGYYLWDVRFESKVASK
jgi:hypothetical protein